MDFPEQNQAHCFCPDGYYRDWNTRKCEKCYSDLGCKYCIGFRPTDCLKCPAWLFWSEKHQACYYAVSGMQMSYPGAGIFEKRKCQDELCDICSASDSTVCLVCKYPQKNAVVAEPKEQTVDGEGDNTQDYEFLYQSQS